MLDKALTYHKSAKGSEAIATRSAAMTPKMRSMLILVDGKRSFDELAKLGGMLGDPEQTLSQLLELGFIEPVAGVSAPAPAPAPAPARPASAPAPASAHPTVPLADAKRYAVRRLTDLLGPGAEDLCIRIEGTKNAADFLAALQKAENVVREFSGQQAAAQFAADMKAHRPA